MFRPNTAFKLFLTETIKYYAIRKKGHPKISMKKDIVNFIDSIDFNSQDIVKEELLTHYSRRYYKFRYKGEFILIW